MGLKMKALFIACLLLSSISPPASAATGTAEYRSVPGLNLPAVTRWVQDQYGSAFPLLNAWKTLAGVTAVETSDRSTGVMLRAELDANGVPAGVDFSLAENAGLFVYSDTGGTLDLGPPSTCPKLNLSTGFNLIGYACTPSEYTARELINSLGLGSILSVSRFDTQSARWVTAAVADGAIVGENFPLTPGEGLIITTSQGVTAWEPPVPVISAAAPSGVFTNQPVTTVTMSGSRFRPDSVVLLDEVPLDVTYVSATQLSVLIPTQTLARSASLTVRNPDTLHMGGYLPSEALSFLVGLPGFSLSPNLLNVRQEETAASLTLSIPFGAPAGGMNVTLASGNTLILTVPDTVTIPQGATSVTVPLTPLATGHTADDPVTVTASLAGWSPAQVTVTVKPKPTINLSPLSTLTGLSFTYLLTVNLTDVAPAEGMAVALSASPAGIVDLPASILIPPGAMTAQITVTATAVGSATITASSAGKGLTGAVNVVTVKPIQTVNYGPVMTPSVGVSVAVAPVVGGSVTYGPVASGSVGVVVGSTVTGVVPGTGPVGASGVKVVVTGVGLSAATAISFQPSTGITIQPGTFAINADGNPEVVIDIDPTATTGARTVLVALPSGTATPASPGADRFTVTLPEPEILSMQPIRAMAGQVVSLNLFGRNFVSGTSVAFSPSAGISVNNPPTINASGTMATVTVYIDATAPLVERVVTITTPGWTSTMVPSVANTFFVTADTGTTYTPLVSGQVGVLVPTEPVTSRDLSFGPVLSGQVGIVVGASITGVQPSTGPLGTTGLKVTVTGSGLAAATALSFQPDTGITVQPGSFAINADGNPEVVIDIDPTAPTTMRTVVVTLASGTATAGGPGANQFRITLPEPQILGMQPIRAMVGQVVTLNLFGTNFTSATSIGFVPSDGISVNNPPAINANGTLATVTLNIAANAPVGDRVVTITTPGWTTTTVPAPANTFAVTADAGTTYTPVVSLQVGVQVTVDSGTTNAPVTYGPVSSTEVGVLVTPVQPPTTLDRAYGPMVSTPIGVVVGGAVTGISPPALEPGSTTTVTLTGVGLDQVTSIAVIPAAGITVGAWTPAADGLSGTVVLTADAAVAAGQKTIVAMTLAAALPPAVPDAVKLLVGHKPSMNSLSPLLPTVGTTFTLTINGVHLQGATKVEILPADDVFIDYPPVWSSDGTGEHLTVKVIIVGAAAPGDRVVVVTTPYGVTTSAGSPANTITLFKPMAQNSTPSVAEETVVAALAFTPGEELPSPVHETAGSEMGSIILNAGWRYDASVGATTGRPAPTTEGSVARLSLAPSGRGVRESFYLFTGYRGPPRTQMPMG